MQVCELETVGCAHHGSERHAPSSLSKLAGDITANTLNPKP